MHNGLNIKKKITKRRKWKQIFYGGIAISEAENHQGPTVHKTTLESNRQKKSFKINKCNKTLKYTKTI